MVGRQADRPKPELRISLSLFDMNVCGFLAFIAEEEEEAIAVDAEDCWHPRKLRVCARLSQVVVQRVLSWYDSPQLLVDCVCAGRLALRPGPAGCAASDLVGERGMKRVSGPILRRDFDKLGHGRSSGNRTQKVDELRFGHEREEHEEV